MALFAAISAFFWIPLIGHYRERMPEWGPDWWAHIDWLLIAIFLFMTTICVFTIDLRRNWSLLGIALLGGLCIEGWGTQTDLWYYYTQERPPLWIIPAWPTAALTIDSLSRLVFSRLPTIPHRRYTVAAAILFPSFFVAMALFTYPYVGYSMTLFSLAVVLLVSLSILMGTCDRRVAVLIFILGSALGYFLELWGTTRHCWNYYTGETPPLFAIFSHGIASVAFWRSHLILDKLVRKVFPHWRGHWSWERNAHSIG